MAAEQFANDATTTLNMAGGTLASSMTATSVTVSSAGFASFPSVPQFRILIDSEIMLVTAINAGTYTWTVQRAAEGSGLASHTNPATVTQVLTAGGLNNLLPTGTILPYGGSSAPSGYLFCNGYSYDGTQPAYTNLWNVIGTSFGGTGQNNFHVPDFRRRVPVGAGGTAISPDLPGTTVGSTGGEETHTLSVAEMPSHNHGIPDGAQDVPRSAVNGVWTNQSIYEEGPPYTASAGGNGTHNNMPPSLVVNYIIKT